MDQATLYLCKREFPKLFNALLGDGYQVIGPTISQEAIIYDQISGVQDLPIGWTETQEPGKYRLHRRSDERWFGFTVGPYSWKRYLFPPAVTVLSSTRHEDGWRMRTPSEPVPRYAFLGPRSCDLHALAIQDRVFMGQAYRDPIYQARREQALVIAVNCTQAASTCFCTSMQTGPRATAGFDLALTELQTGFTVEVGSDRGRELAARLELPTAGDDFLPLAAAARQAAVDQITRRMDTGDLRNVLLSNLDHPRWDHVAARCLSCANCTMVCPTCFCSSVREVSDLDGDHVERQRVWDSCFSLEFSHMHGANIRQQTRSRYRQWLTHKLASWIDQFDTSGCVGCGRCITWCPVGIDLTEEVAAIRTEPALAAPAPSAELASAGVTSASSAQRAGATETRP